MLIMLKSTHLSRMETVNRLLDQKRAEQEEDHRLINRLLQANGELERQVELLSKYVFPEVTVGEAESEEIQALEREIADIDSAMVVEQGIKVLVMRDRSRKRLKLDALIKQRRDVESKLQSLRAKDVTPRPAELPVETQAA